MPTDELGAKNRLEPLVLSSDFDLGSLVRQVVELELQEVEDTVGAQRSDDPQSADGRQYLPAKASRQHHKRQKKRQRELEAHGYTRRSRSSVAVNHIRNSRSIPTKLELRSLPAQRTAYAALSRQKIQDPSRARTVEELVNTGYTYVKAQPGVDRPIVTADGIVWAVYVSPPQDETFESDALNLFDNMIEWGRSTEFTSKELKHKRGDFPAINVGYTVPAGFSEPVNLSLGKHGAVVEKVRAHRGFKRIVGYQEAVFAMWNPGVYNHYRERLRALIGKFSHLVKNVASGILPTVALNFRNVRTFFHTDPQNCPYGWCMVTPLGRFDATQGAHLILEEPKLVFEFPHGSTFCLPSAVINHANTAPAKGDVRLSITQYCSAQFGLEHFKVVEGERQYRWIHGLSLFSTLEALLQANNSKQ